MTVARYGLGLLLAVATLAPLLTAAGALRRSLLPDWSGAPAELVRLVLTIAGLIVILQVLGLVGLLYALPVALASVAVGVGVRHLAARLGARHAEEGSPQAPGVGLVPALVATVGVAVVVAEWCTRLLPALDHGMTGADTVWYHLPQAASFVQNASIAHVQFFETGAGTAFYPATSGLFHALGMLWFGNDFPSVFMNVGWLGMALLAAWCLGRPYGRGPVCVLGLCLLLATPIMVETQPGGAYNDLMGLTLLLAAAALLVNGGPTGVPGAIAALAAAPALGTKLTMAVPLVALAVGAVAITPAGRRARTAAIWLGALLALGVLWYARNLVAFGNPVPAAHLELGPVALPSPPLTSLTYSLIHYAGTPGVLRGTFLPGLLDGYGPAWWALLGLAAVGMVAVAVSGRTRVERMLGVVAIVSAVAFVFTPQGLGTEDDPLFFKFNLRYPTPAIALGLVLLPLVPALAARVRQQVLLGLYAAVLLVTQLDPAIWPTDLREGRFAEPPSGREAAVSLALGAAFLAVVVAFALLRRRATPAGRGPVLAASLAALVALVVGGWFVQHDYLRGRYADFEPMPRVARWARRRGGRADRDRRLLPPVPALWQGPLEPRGVRGPSRTARGVHADQELCRVAQRAERRRLRLRGHHAVQLPGQPARRSAGRGRLDGLGPVGAAGHARSRRGVALPARRTARPGRLPRVVVRASPGRVLERGHGHDPAPAVHVREVEAAGVPWR